MICAIILIFVLFGKYSTAEIHLSTAHIKQELERIRYDNSLQTIKILLYNNDSKLTNVKRLVDKLEQLQEEARNPSFTVNHPLDACRFIRNNSVIFNETVTELVTETEKIGNGNDAIRSIAQNLVALSKEDLMGSLKDLIRIQYTYGLKTQDLADGNVLGQYRSQMNAVECKDMMVIAFYSDQIVLAVEWLHIAIQRVESGDESIMLTNLLIKAAASAYDTNSNDIADKLFGYILKENPKNRYLKHKMKHYKRDNPKHNNVVKFSICSNHFRDSCRNTVEQPKQKPNRNHFCSYIDNGHPYLRYQPGKVEILSSDPVVLVFHDAFTSRTLSTFIKPIKPYLSRSLVNASKTLTVSEDRTSKGMAFGFGGLLDEFYKYIGALTSLKWESFEHLQIQNYGIGGHYGIHQDSFNYYKTNTTKISNNRIATFMIYFTDVGKGGATVFPDADVSVLPKAGKAVFWYNLKPDGSACEKVLHAACPVVIGDKYIGNIWIRERGQEFTRPCNLDQKDTKHKWPFTNFN